MFRKSLAATSQGLTAKTYEVSNVFLHLRRATSFLILHLIDLRARTSSCWDNQLYDCCAQAIAAECGSVFLLRP